MLNFPQKRENEGEVYLYRATGVPHASVTLLCVYRPRRRLSFSRDSKDTVKNQQTSGGKVEWFERIARISKIKRNPE